MVVYKDYISFTVMGQEVILVSDETNYGRNTVAEVTGSYYYLGDEVPTIPTAIIVWQELNGRNLTSEELRQTLLDNRLASSTL